ncbi:unnamed protein product [Allacma fusca]|uniref:Uncharacterized protein n=1 Tax=Allacma fusca TaxID=39272 RepID=A0A8J2PVE5_9HEXA|nr:unnamed protein product [Allacma fusca]
MKTTFSLFAFGVFVALAQSAPAEEDGVTEVPTVQTPSCIKTPFPKEDIEGSVTCSSSGTLAFTPEFKQKAKRCSDPEIWGTEEGKKNPNCKFFCQGRGVGVLNENGIPTDELYNTYIDLAFPVDSRPKVKSHVEECIATLGNKVDPKDSDCVGAAEFNKCVFQVFTYTC